MKNVYILKGLPASGKSSWAKEMVSKNPGAYKRINKDDLRAMLDHSHHSKGNEKFVLRARDWLIKEALHAGKHVIVDDTNLNPKHELNIRALVEDYMQETQQQVQVIVKFFEVSLEECIARDLKRPVSVGERVIRRIYKDYLAPKQEERFNEYCIQDENLPRAIICDIDGTLAILKGRNPFDGSRCENDLLNIPVYNIVKKYHELGHEIILLSGREGKYRPQTENWLRKFEIPYHQLLMRAEGDQRKDSLIKREIFEQNIQGKYHIDFVLDDRNQVVDMWRKELGLACLQVNYGDF